MLSQVVPFGDYIVPKLDFFSVVLPRLVEDTRDIASGVSFAVDSSRLKQQVVYFAVTGQILQAVEEYFVPYIKRKFFSEAKRITHIGDDDVPVYETEEEKVFLEKVLREIELPEYEIFEDYDEMVVQVYSPLIESESKFGFITLWSIVWPIIPFACFINNWMEVRADSAKICTSRRRPVPHRGDSIGPWLDNISFLAWLGSLTTCTLIYLFRGDDTVFQFDKTTIIYLLVTFVMAEHGYWIVDRVVGTVLERFKTDSEVNVMREDYVLRRKQLRDIGLVMDQNFKKSAPGERKIVPDGGPPGFWRGRGVECTVYEGKEFLSRGWNRRKTQ